MSKEPMCLYSLSLLLMILFISRNISGCESQKEKSSQLSFVKLNQASAHYDGEASVTFKNHKDNRIAIMTSGCSLKDDSYIPTLSIENKKNEQWSAVGAPLCIEIATPRLF